MTKQLKIIIEYEEEGIDNDINGPLTKVTVLRDDEKIRMLQAIKFSASAQSPFADLELVFPDLSDWAPDSETAQEIDKQIKILSEIVGVKVVKRL